MRRALALVSVAAASLAAAASGGRAAGVDCHAAALTFLFWPHGHGAVAAAGFPPASFAHVEVYRTAAGRYPRSHQVAFAQFEALGATGAGFARSCTPAAVADRVDAERVTRTAATAVALVCAFRAPVRFDYERARSSIMLRALVPAASGLRLGASVRFSRSGSLLRYDAASCRAAAPPR
ncbi:MAG TPA: hypothetical protein VFB42_04200 [Gaiellaceae bacterium]|nr:hypothetical protein [Gaiellaceae bacterium]